MAYVNRTVVHFNSDGSIRAYLVKPEYFYGEVIREDFTDGSFVLKYPMNRTVRFFPPPLPATATKKDYALGLLYFDKFTNGTVRKVFLNGTIATYYNGLFLRYDAKP
jgi:hypothetical protein